jgi:gluconolactonase
VPIPALVGSAVLVGVLACVLAVLALPKRQPASTPGDDEHASLPTQDESRRLVKHTPATPPAAVPDEPEEEPLAPGNDTPRTLAAPDQPAGERPVPSTPTPRAVEPPAAPAPKAETPRPAGKLVVKRRGEIGEDDLTKQLLRAPELTLDRSAQRAESQQLIVLGRKVAKLGHDAGTTVGFLEKRPDLAGMPWRKGDACRISSTAADHLQEGSLALRAFMSDVSRAGLLVTAGGGGGGARPDPKSLHAALNKDGRDHNRWLKAEAIPALQQLLMAEHEAVREVLVDQLARIDGKKASEALAQRALFDLHPRVRERALKELVKRPADEYRAILVKGFEHPWPPVAEHAAEALATLNMKETVPALLTLLDMPDPQAPYRDPTKGAMVKEMVRVNHLLNCLMCHAPSLKTEDKVRGRMPPTNQPLPPAFSRAYYADRTGVFVRADRTYLRQDFSVPLPVKNPGVWPEVQRYDFLVRERPATLHDLNAVKKRDARQPSEQHRSLFFALRELTGADPGPTVEDWKQFLLRRKVTVRAVSTGFKAARGLAVDREGRVYVADRGVLLRKEGDGRPTSWLEDRNGSSGLAVNEKDHLLAAQGKTGQVVRIPPDSREVRTLAARFDGKRFNLPSRLVVDRHGGVYFTDDRPPSAPYEGGTYYVAAAGSVTRLPVALSRPRGLGLSPDGKTLYVSSPATPDVLAYPIESAGSIGKGRVVGRLPGATANSGPADLSVDSRGNLHLLNAQAQTVEVVAPEGARLSVARLPDTPVACCFAKGKLYVLTRKALYTVEAADLDFTRMARR